VKLGSCLRSCKRGVTHTGNCNLQSITVGCCSLSPGGNRLARCLCVLFPCLARCHPPQKIIWPWFLLLPHALSTSSPQTRRPLPVCLRVVVVSTARFFASLAWFLCWGEIHCLVGVVSHSHRPLFSALSLASFVLPVVFVILNPLPARLGSNLVGSWLDGCLLSLLVSLR
jgi:hypothetical protein